MEKNNIENENNAQNNIQKQTNSIKNEKKINLSAILSFIFAVLGICLAIIINAYVYETQQESGAYYMWPLGAAVLILFISMPIAIFALIMGTIGLTKSYKYKEWFLYDCIAILGIVVSIISIIINYITMQQLS